MSEFFDYRCPYWRTMQPTLDAVLARDRRVRLVAKEWPIFGGASVIAARVAPASQGQGKYAAVHKAMFDLPRTMDEAAIRSAAATADVDMARLDRDLVTVPQDDDHGPPEVGMDDQCKLVAPTGHGGVPRPDAGAPIFQGQVNRAGRAGQAPEDVMQRPATHQAPRFAAVSTSKAEAECFAFGGSFATGNEWQPGQALAE